MTLGSATVQPQSGAGNSGERPIYNWQRFWVPRTGTVDLSDGGFLADPTNLLLRSSATKPHPLTELTDYRALVLLGEPGIGKSTTLLEEAERVAKQAVVENTISIHIDLRAYSSDLLLHKKVFESAEFVAWLHGSSHLVLHLDSLDEALLRIDSIANLLAGELPRYPASRMSLRIACRTAVWPSETLETALGDIWGKAGVGVFELAPLRRRDIVAATVVQGIDGEAFIHELYAANAVPFAIKPLTLNLLFGIFKKEGRLPRSLTDLYVRGCLKLCEVSNQSRRDARRLGSLTAAQRLRLASEPDCGYDDVRKSLRGMDRARGGRRSRGRRSAIGAYGRTRGRGISRFRRYRGQCARSVGYRPLYVKGRRSHGMVAPKLC
jgi:hypothetical protein